MNTILDDSVSDETEINSNHPLQTSNLVPCRIKLKPGENFATIHVDYQGVCTKNVEITIDDEDYNWQAGQSLKIYFYCENGSLSFGDRSTYGIVISPRTGATSLSIEGSEFEGNNLIEVICIEEGRENSDYKFIYLIK